MEKSLTIFLILISSISHSQSFRDTVNHFNSKHQKNGYWVIYLNERLVPVKDTSQARFYGFNYYDNGVLVGFFPAANQSRKRAKKIDYHGLDPIKGKILLLDGRITYYEKDSATLDEVYENGIPLCRRGFFWDRRGQPAYTQILNYKKEFKNETGSFYYEYLQRKDTLEKIWYRKKSDVWRLHYNKRYLPEEATNTKLKYDIEAMDRNGKGLSFWNAIPKLNLKFDVAYERTYMGCQWLQGMNFTMEEAVDRNFSIGFCYSALYAASQKNYGFNNVGQISAFEDGTLSLNYYFFSGHRIKIGCGLNMGIFENYLQNDKGRRLAKNDYWMMKPDLEFAYRFQRVQMYAKLYYRVLTLSRFGPSTFYRHSMDFWGPGICLGVSLK
jgi:hypothetical protein